MSKIKVTQEMVDWCRGLGDGSLDPNKECNLLFENKFSFGIGLCAPFQALFLLTTDNLFDNPITNKYKPTLSDLINFSKFPKYSGYHAFPVTASDIDNAGSHYNKCFRTYLGGFWDNDEYGNNRREFALWCADELEKLL